MLETKHLLVAIDFHNMEVNGYRQLFHFWVNFPFNLTKLLQNRALFKKKYLIDF